MKFKKTTLPNGLRVVTVPADGNPSVTVMVLVETGSNYEKKDENGLSHFLEHMCFKGTANRPTSLDISKELDALGATNNAFTSNEVTGYYAKANKKHFKKLFDVVSDTYLNSTFPEPELERERGVILQEISMYEDLPQRKVWDELSTLMYGDTPAGQTILGPRENIRKFSRKDFVNYHKRHYVAGKTIVVVAGDVSHKDAVVEAKRFFKDIPTGPKAGKPKVVNKQKAPALRVCKKKTDQTHMVMTFRAYPAGDKRTTALELMATVLGRGMSSRLFQKMREELGACYYVRAGSEAYTDHGVLAIATGIEAKRAEEVTGVLIDECRKIAQEGVAEEELQKAKEYYVGHMYMNLETSDGLADYYAGQEIAAKKMKTPQEAEKEARAIKPKDLQRVARDIFRNKNLNMAVLGNIKDDTSIKKALKFN